jgi:putative oxygen-independent coproporphyrinogen III oxidase
VPPLPAVVARLMARASLPPPRAGSRGQSPRADAADNPVAPTALSPSGILATTGPTEPSVGIYVHVPFCVKKCYFCSFNTAPFESDAMQRYLRALHREIDLVGAVSWAHGLRVETVFLGGGTPSLLDGADLARLLDHVRGAFVVEPDAEVTVESNPESLHVAKLAAYREAGVTRISLGVQTLDDALLPAIGRLHDTASSRAAFMTCREVGFDDVSVDLMYGLPHLSVDAWTSAVRTVLDWEPDHLSAYGLTLDAGSLWGTSGVSGLPAEEAVVAQYWALTEEAARRGFEHYEVSNYARAGRRSRHNQRYWRRREYLALGPGACGFVGDVRYANVKPVTRYAALLESRVLPIDTSERLTAAQALAERLFLGLRTVDGVARADLEARIATRPVLQAHVDGWIADGLMTGDRERVRLTERGLLVSDTLFVELL